MKIRRHVSVTSLLGETKLIKSRIKSCLFSAFLTTEGLGKGMKEGWWWIGIGDALWVETVDTFQCPYVASVLLQLLQVLLLAP